jgi:hypothetical protein
VATPFRLRYTLGRGDRFAVEFPPHLPACGAALGFTTGIAYLGAFVSPWFLALLVFPAYICRRPAVLLVELLALPEKPTDVLVEAARIGLLVGEKRVWHDLDGVIQVYRSDGWRTWTLLHLDGFVLTIPSTAIEPHQLDFLKAFALRAWRARQRALPVI